MTHATALRNIALGLEPDAAAELLAAAGLIEVQSETLARFDKPIKEYEGTNSEVVRRLLGRARKELSMTYTLLTQSELRGDEEEESEEEGESVDQGEYVRYIDMFSSEGCTTIYAEDVLSQADAQLLCMAPELALWGLQEHRRAEDAERRAAIMVSRFGTTRLATDDLLGLTKVLAFAFQKNSWYQIAQYTELSDEMLTRLSELAESIERRTKPSEIEQTLPFTQQATQ